MSNQITRSEKVRIVNEASELYFPRTISTNLENDLVRLWEGYVSSCYPDVDATLFHVLSASVVMGDRTVSTNKNLRFVRTAFSFLKESDYGYSNGMVVDAEKCTIPHFREVAQMLCDFEGQKKKFETLLQTKLSGINTPGQFRKNLPELSHLLSGHEDFTDLAVPLDLSNLTEEVIAV
jgi:hypothetical protein